METDQQTDTITTHTVARQCRGVAQFDYLIQCWQLRGRRGDILEKAGCSDWFGLRKRVLSDPTLLPRPWSEIEATMPVEMKAILTAFWHYQMVEDRDEWEDCVLAVFETFTAMAYELFAEAMARTGA